MRFAIGIVVVIAGFGVVATSVATAQSRQPKPPDTYEVEFRYRIKAGRNDRIVQFTALAKHLASLGFKRVENDDSDLDIFDPTAERMNGTIPAANARKLLAEPHIETVLIAPAGFKPPADENEAVKVLIDLSGGFMPEQQQEFSRQVKQVLAGFGFKEATSYDHRGYTRLRGTMPWVKTTLLLQDLRTLPTGWFLPLIHEDDRPALLKSKLPIRLIELLPENEVPAPVIGQEPLPPVPPEQSYVHKLAADLQRYFLTAKEGTPVRVEATFAFPPTESDNSWRERVRLALPTTTFEGLNGSVVTLTVTSLEQAKDLARLPFILSMRLPRAATLPKLPVGPVEEKKDEPKATTSLPIVQAQGADAFDVLKATALDRLHATGGRGTGLRVAIIDTDFSGWEKYRGKELPQSTFYIDLTAERNSEIQPEQSTTPEGTMGHGAHCALAVRLAAPDADIAMVRIAPDAPYQVLTAYRAILGEYFQPVSFRSRREELEADTAIMRGERGAANAEYRKAFDDFEDDEPARDRKRAAKAAIAAVEVKERALATRANRLVTLERELVSLGGCKVILNLVGWNSGQPLDATSAMARFLDDKMGVGRPNPLVDAAKQPQPTLWFQPAGDTRGQSWLGTFRDADGNGIMEFAAADEPLRKNRWTRELNFVKLRTDAGPDEADLPAGMRLRVSVQWREPHDPKVSEVEYRRPLAPLSLMLVRQRDPDADKLADDEVEIMARSGTAPERLVSEPDFGIYEQSIELVLPAAGRYAVRVDGRQPNTLLPGGALGIREQEIHWEFRPRLFLEVVDPATRAKGRPIFGDYESFLGGVAVPGDARTVVGVGAMHANRQPEPFSAIGAGPVSDLLIKPNVMTYDQLPKLGDGTGPARGTALSAAFAAGTGTSLLSAGAESANFLRYLRLTPGSILDVPKDWRK